MSIEVNDAVRAMIKISGYSSSTPLCLNRRY